MNRHLIVSAATFLFLAGCAIQQTDQDVSPDVEAAAEAAKADAMPVEEKQVEPEPKPVEEPVVEVISREKQDEPEVSAEPLPIEQVETPEPVEVPEKAEAPEPAPAEEQPKAEEKIETPPVDMAVTKEPVETKPVETTEPETAVKKSYKDGEFEITVAPKDQSHPYFGKGYPKGFVMNGVQGKEIVLEKGKTYNIAVNTDPKHDVYLSTKEIGWGSTPWVDGVTGMYIYKGTITIEPSAAMPKVLYYSCRNHPYMGSKIHIVNPGETVEIKQATSTGATTNTKQAISEAASAAKVSQKLMFANMLLNSKSGSRVAESGIQDAIDLQNQAKNLIESAKAKMKDGDNDNAYTDAENALNMLKKSSRLVPNEEQLQELKARNKELLASIKDYEKSHSDNVKRIAKAKEKGDSGLEAVPYDVELVEKLKSNSAAHAEAGDYARANKELEQAQTVITTALQKMLHTQTIVYDLNFETPKDEYEYELKRFGGYEELVPVAIEAKKPSEGSIKLMNSFLDKARKMRDQAIAKADEGDYPVAIRMMLDATKTVRRALRMVGVMQ